MSGARESWMSPPGSRAESACDAGMTRMKAPDVEPCGPQMPQAKAPLAEPTPSELEFTGCTAVPMSYEELRRYEGRMEVWDAELQTAWMVREPTSPTHERPSHRLARLVERIAAVRGSAIECYGAMDLLLCDALGAARRIMQADQTVYLHPSRVDLLNAEAMRVGEHNFPDVVLEVDHTTDVRRGKLRLYESWGFPELWVEVPDPRTPSRPESRPSGLTIHLLERGAYRSSPVSRAFPGWTAQAIHDAMNEPAPSARTHAILEGVGRALGAREGTGPDDDPLLRSLRDQSRAEGRQKDRAEGEARGRAGMACAILASRGIDVSEGFPANVPAFAESPVAVVVAAALHCESEQDFRKRIRER